MRDVIDDILVLSRQAKPLTEWFADRLGMAVRNGVFATPEKLGAVRDQLVTDLRNYTSQTGMSTAVIGMSGGVDSSLTAALLKRAGWTVLGFTLPIAQNPEETQGGIEACAALGIEHQNIDLTEEYHVIAGRLSGMDRSAQSTLSMAEKIRHGNVRARLRMLTLYDQAHRRGGLVASTDNFSELAAGFWTLHGDVGDLAPVQALLKSWEVPWMARECGVPKSIWTAKPTDGLGISDGDEAQLGTSYLEWDLIVMALAVAATEGVLDMSDPARSIGMEHDAHAQSALELVLQRVGGSWYKRENPIRLDHPASDRYGMLEALDRRITGC